MGEGDREERCGRAIGGEGAGTSGGSGIISTLTS